MAVSQPGTETAIIGTKCASASTQDGKLGDLIAAKETQNNGTRR
jgi:hypothetical protein